MLFNEFVTNLKRNCPFFATTTLGMESESVTSAVKFMELTKKGSLTIFRYPKNYISFGLAREAKFDFLTDYTSL